jgi:hypothetical protein
MLRHKHAAGKELEQAGQEVLTPVYSDSHGYRYVETHEINSDNLQQLVTAAVARALEDTNGRNIVVVNLNIQVAHGGGAKNFWSGNDNELWERK